jgi:hypothetical protein
MSATNPSPLPDGSKNRPLPQPNAAGRNSGSPAGREGPTLDEGGEALPQLSFWQQPFVQNMLPFLTSLMMHAAIIVIGVATLKVVTIEAKKTELQTETPEGTIEDANMPQVLVAHPGLGGDPTRDAMQDKYPDVKDAHGFSEDPGTDMTSLLKGGGESDDPGSIIGLGVGKGFGMGTGYGSGKGNGGPLAPFGPPGGGGGLGVKFITSKTQAKRIVFICDATGSMMSEFDNLRVELRKAVEGLKPPQAFNVVFFQENAPPPIDKGLLFASPDNKRRIYDFVDKYTPRGPTDPKPAIQLAFAMKPDLIFFLCDPSDFPDPSGTITMFKQLNAANAEGKCRVNTIDFMGDLDDKAGETLLKTISADSHGTFTYVSQDDMAK